ncbi:hypothetical protein ACLOJK_015341 [Asimina triloba]
MAMRELVTGGAACAVPGAPPPSSNPLGTLANALLGSARKNKEVVNELPVATVTRPDGPHGYGTEASSTSLPGFETDHKQYHYQDTHSSEFLRRFRDHGALEDVWDEVHQSPIPHARGSENQGNLTELEHVYGDGLRSHLQPTWDGMF